MSRSIKEDVKLLKDIKDELFNAFNPDTISSGEMEQIHQLIVVVFENQNKWLLSDKISSEKQGRMDAYNKDKGTFQASGSSGTSDMDSPTPAQVRYATQLGIDVVGKSKKEVSNLIDKAKKSEPRK
jgi:hypothetical protein